MWEGKVPFQDNSGRGYYPPGSLMCYPEEWLGVEWKDTYEFEDVLHISGMERGRSAARFIAESRTDGLRYTIFMTDLLDIIQSVGVEPGGIVRGRWGFVKRGANYGIALVPKGE